MVIRRLDLPGVLLYLVEKGLDDLLLILQYLGVRPQLDACRSISPQLKWHTAAPSVAPLHVG